jgi:glyoxylase-like metal-dependent hydrolase (beta-lactamase superfamily II)
MTLRPGLSNVAFAKDPRPAAGFGYGGCRDQERSKGWQEEMGKFLYRAKQRPGVAGERLSGYLRVCLAGLVCGLASSGFAQDQFGPPANQPTGPRLATPTVFPMPASFPTTESLTLLDAVAGAEVHYTLNGSIPTDKSPVAGPNQLLFLSGIYEGDRGLKAGYTVRAVAMKSGYANSDIATFQYTIDRRDRTVYVSEEVLPGVRMIRDSDNDKMFLIHGTQKYLLIDCGLGRGELGKYIEQFTHGQPLEVVFTHNHFDHIGQADQFIAHSIEHIGAEDRAGLVQVLQRDHIADDVIEQHVRSVINGEEIDLGGDSVQVYLAPGHTKGSLVVLDKKTGYLFTGDSFGSNSPTIPDALWLQLPGTPTAAQYLDMIQHVRSELAGREKYILTGHNDHPLQGDAYLNNLQTACHLLITKGRSVLVPSIRPAGVLQVVVGDRLTDPNWVAINVNPAQY